MEIFFGYVAAGLIGVILGLIGGGGSILTVPILVYCFHIDPSIATAYSLFIVGMTSFAGGVSNAIRGLVDFKTALVFSIPSFIGVYITRRYVMQLIPEEIFPVGSFIVTKGVAMMILFGLLMLVAGLSMIVKFGDRATDKMPFRNYPMMIATGFGVGILTGIVGMGGGFLIIPALVFFAGLPMKKAVGTSLVIIAAKSLVGFVGDIRTGLVIDFWFISTISMIAIAGIALGTYSSRFIEGRKLKLSFGWFVIGMSSWILMREAGIC